VIETFVGVKNDQTPALGRAAPRWCRLAGRRDRSVEKGDALVGADEDVGRRPVLDDAHDAASHKQTSWHNPTRSAAMATTMSQVALSSELVKGNRVSPESFRRQMCCSTWA